MWFTCNWRDNQKTQKQSAYSLKYRIEAKKVYKRLRQSTQVQNRLHQSTDSTARLPNDSKVMANCNPVIPVMDWTEDAELHKRYVEWREEVELELGSSLSGKSNSVKSNYVLRWAGKPARDCLESLPESEFKYEGASAESILQALEQKTKPKSNEIAAFTKLRSLKQGDIPLSEFIHEARRLAELCNYPNDKDRLIRDTIVSGIQSLRAYQKCIDAKDLESTRLHKHLPSRGYHKNASTRVQTRVCQVNTKHTDCSPSPQTTKQL